MKHYVVWWIFTYVSEELTTSIIQADDAGNKLL
jgi:hypothetical protein